MEVSEYTPAFTVPGRLAELPPQFMALFSKSGGGFEEILKQYMVLKTGPANRRNAMHYSFWRRDGVLSADVVILIDGLILNDGYCRNAINFSQTLDASSKAALIHARTRSKKLSALTAAYYISWKQKISYDLAISDYMARVRQFKTARTQGYRKSAREGKTKRDTSPQRRGSETKQADYKDLYIRQSEEILRLRNELTKADATISSLRDLRAVQARPPSGKSKRRRRTQPADE